MSSTGEPMPRLRYEGREVPIDDGETVLDACARAGVVIPSSCRSGACQSCLVRAVSGAVPAAAQIGLGAAKRELGHFLACVCKPSEDLEVEPVGAAADLPATIVEIERLAPTVSRVMLRPREAMSFRAGQFVTLLREDGLARAYSLASLPGEELLELHVRRAPGGQMSTWLHDQAPVGAEVILRGPAGECFYVADDPTRPLVLVGVGTGLAPLWGIVRDALTQGHEGPVVLLHGGRSAGDLYLRGPLEALAAAKPRVDLRFSILAGEAEPRVVVGELDALAKSVAAGLPGRARARAFVCGDPALVQRLKRALFLAGLSLREILGDAFVQAPAPVAASPR